MADRASGAAWRRKQRRLRSWWRHEQQTVASVLATATHHSHSKVGTSNAILRGQKIGTSTGAVPAEHSELSSDDGMPTTGMRPASMLEPWPQGKVQWHSGIGYELVQALDAPVLQVEEQLPNVLQLFVTSVPAVAEQVINAPKISHDRTQQRLVDYLRQPQMAEQLMEVPTIVSYSSLQGVVEQNVDIAGGGLRGFLPGESYSLSSEQIIDNPVPRRGDQGGFQGFPQGQNPAAFVEHSVDIPVLLAKALNSLILVVHALPQYRVKRLGMVFF